MPKTAPVDTERIELPEDNWWVIKTVVTRRMRQSFQADSASALDLGFLRNGNKDVDLSDAKEIARIYAEQPDAAKVGLGYTAAMEEAYLLHGTEAWSYGVDITRDAILDMDERITDVVLERMRALYDPVPEETLKNSEGTPSP